jgi:hypothetical protein
MNAAAAGVIVLVASELSTDGGIDLQFLAQLADEGLLRSLAVLHFAPWKFPLERMPVASTALADQHSSIAMNDARRDKQRYPVLHVLPLELDEAPEMLPRFRQ